jgi:TolB-like protein/tetratricopeptide (TPR) repeat protein
MGGALTVNDIDDPRRRVRFGIFEVDLRTGELWKSGRKLKLTGQPFSVLAILLERPGEVIGREELQRRLWPDTFVDVDHNLNTAINKIRETLADSAERPRFVETLSRRGYRFIAPIENADSGASAQSSDATVHSGGRMKSSSRARAEEGFWIAVLPLKLSDADVDLADHGMSLIEEIVTGLSRFSYLRVISLSSTSQYAGKSVDVRTAGKELGARYVIEGSLRHAGARVRIAAQLVDCKSGAHLWAETYDRPFSNEAALGLFDDVVPQIVSTIADTHGVLPRSMSEVLRTKDPSSLSPYEAVLRSFAYFKRVSAEEHAPARAALERAVRQEPNYPDAWAMLSLIYKEEFTHRFNVLPDPLGRALAAAQRAVEGAPSNHLACHALASVEFFRKEFDAFQIATARAVALNPMDGFTLAYLGFLTAYAGDWERGGALSAKARSLNPHHPGWYWFVPCFEAYRKGEYKTSLEFAHKVNMPGFWRTQLAIAANSGQLGQQAAANEALRTLLMQRPDIARLPREELAIWWQPDMVEHLIAGLRKAGLEV